jgi:hypothetical protein
MKSNRQPLPVRSTTSAGAQKRDFFFNRRDYGYGIVVLLRLFRITYIALEHLEPFPHKMFGESLFFGAVWEALPHGVPMKGCRFPAAFPIDRPQTSIWPKIVKFVQNIK